MPRILKTYVVKVHNIHTRFHIRELLEHLALQKEKWQKNERKVRRKITAP